MTKPFLHRHEALRAEFDALRARTEALAAPLTPEDQTVQTMADVSPSKWHRAHTTWFWETFLLKPHLAGYAVFDADFDYLFNSYYEQVGERHPRAERGFVTRPSCAEIAAWRAHVDAAMGRLLDATVSGEVEALIRLGIAHEEQHQELFLTDIKHVLSRHPFAPGAYPPPAALAAAAAPAGWLGFEGGLVEIGHAGPGFAFDNEGPRCKVWLEPFEIAAHPVTNADYADFIADGGYETAALWLSDGWALVCAEDWRAPLYWRMREGTWREFTLHGEQAPEPDAPVCHLSFYEAAAFAEWAGARLPSEAEWETAAVAARGPDGRFMEAGVSAHPGPSPAGEGMAQAFGGVWEWTRSDYAPYPGFRPAAGAVGEYNGKFMCGQYVLRGGSCATPPGHVRPTYRNFFPPAARWQFSGVRLAR